MLKWVFANKDNFHQQIILLCSAGREVMKVNSGNRFAGNARKIFSNTWLFDVQQILWISVERRKMHCASGTYSWNPWASSRRHEPPVRKTWRPLKWAKLRYKAGVVQLAIQCNPRFYCCVQNFWQCGHAFFLQTFSCFINLANKQLLFVPPRNRWNFLQDFGESRYCNELKAILSLVRLKIQCALCKNIYLQLVRGLNFNAISFSAAVKLFQRLIYPLTCFFHKHGKYYLNISTCYSPSLQNAHNRKNDFWWPLNIWIIAS